MHYPSKQLHSARCLRYQTLSAERRYNREIGKRGCEYIKLSQARKVIPEIKNFHMLRSSGDSYIGVVQIGKKSYAHFAKQVMEAVWATHKGCWIKFLIVVDEDIDIYSVEDVIWAISMRVQPHSDTLIVDEHIGFPLDPSANVPGISFHMGIDATVKIPERFTEYSPSNHPEPILNGGY